MYWEKKNQLEKLTKTKSEVKWVTGRHSQDRGPASAGPARVRLSSAENQKIHEWILQTPS